MPNLFSRTLPLPQKKGGKFQNEHQQSVVVLGSRYLLEGCLVLLQSVDRDERVRF